MTANIQPTTTEQKVMDILATWSETEKNIAYHQLWLPHVIEDISSYMEEYLETDQYLTNDEIVHAARRYVYDGRYDCNLSYWQNLENLMDEALRNRKA